MTPRLCVISGRWSDVTACLLCQILARRDRTGLVALSRGRGEEGLIRRLEGAKCRRIVVALPEDVGLEGPIHTAVILTRGPGEAAQRLVAGCRQAVLSLDDPDGIVPTPAHVRRWTYSERHNEADLTAKNLRLLPFRTQFEAVSANAICRLSVPLPDGRGLYPGLAAATAAMALGVPLEESAAAIAVSEPVPRGMIPLPKAGPFAAAGYFEPYKERTREI